LPYVELPFLAIDNIYSKALNINVFLND